MLEINLLPWREAQKNKQRYRRGLGIFCALLFSASLILVLHFAMESQLKRVRQRVSQAQQGLDQMNKKVVEAKALYQTWDYQKLSEPDLSAILNHQHQVLAFLRQLAALMPPTMYARQIHFHETSWSVEGGALILADILHFTEQIKKNLKTGAGKLFPAKERQLKISQKNGLFDYQLRFESSL